MTLNITIVSPVGIHQSADFQISKTERDADGNWIELQPNSSKIVPLLYQKWSGFLTYCGIGLWKGKRTDEYAVEWLVNLSNSDATFQDAVEKIREQGTAWIASINRSHGKVMVHSFVLAGYEGGTPVYAIVSNYQTLTENITPISNELKVDISRPTTGIHVFVTGIRRAVSDTKKRWIKRLAQIRSDAIVIRRELAKTNLLAAQSPAAENGISTACLTFSLDIHGGGGGEVHGDVPGPLMPRTVLGGFDTAKIAAQVFKSSPNVKFIQGVFGANQSNDATIREDIDCELRFNKEHQEPNAPEPATVEEIGAINDYHLSMHGLNNKGYIVGQLRNPLGAQPHAFVWPPGQDLVDLGTFGGPFSNAFSVNDISQVVGAAHADQSATHGFLWDKNEGMRDLGTLGGRDSVARSINNNCQIVGNSFVGAGEPKQEAERAFLWTPAGGMTNLGDQFEGWSRAVAINNAGVVLGSRLRKAVVCGFVWSPESGVIDLVGEGGRAFFPCAINDSGLVVGEGDDSSGKRRAFSWTNEEGLRQLAGADDFHPSDVDVHGNIVGNVNSRPWSRPYLYSTIKREFLALPFVEEHHTSVKAINGSGVIVGAAWKGSWKHSHPLIWRLNLNSLLSG
jgi:probable HAF family extracellular repeat protein